MHATVVSSIVDDAHFDIVFPATDANDPESILAAPARPNAFYGVFRRDAVSATKVSAAMLAEIASRGLAVTVTAGIREMEPPLPATSASVAGIPSPLALAPPPAAHHHIPVGSLAPGRHRAATTGAQAVGRKPLSVNAGHLAGSPTLSRRTSSLKAGGRSPGGAAASSSSADAVRKSNFADRVKTPVAGTPVPPHHRDAEMVFSQSYGAGAGGAELEPLISANGSLAIFPLRIPIAVGTPKSGLSSYDLSVSATITAKGTQHDPVTADEALCDPDEFDAPNLLAGLSNDPFFNPERLPKHSLPHHARKPSIVPYRIASRVVEKALGLEPMATVRVGVTNLRPSVTLVSLMLETSSREDAVCHIDDLRVFMTHAVTSPVDDFQWKDEPLRFQEELHVVYSSTLLDVSPFDVENAASPLKNQQSSAVTSLSSLDSLTCAQIDRELTIALEGRCSMPGTRNQKIVSNWFLNTPSSGSDSNVMVDGVPTYGKKHNIVTKEVEMPAEPEFSGFRLSFSVPGPVFVRKVFTAQLFLINRTDQIWYITVVVPSKEPSARNMFPTAAEPIVSGSKVPDLRAREQDFLQRYTAMEQREASLVCLENNVELGPLRPNSCETVNLHFVALKGTSHVIEHIQLLDRKTGRVIDLRDVLEIQLESN
ncbi:hypothetical protein HDU87_005986 [Geranomyces variabilis]|uniref:Trafficking protein particle complex II-specific subunit 65 IgD3 domain-containing protein n=1 Tax=Geranomyces variabilis TaxID=109894 RepID=A0AAD5TQA7_9FUNG|nr:hypothetical protein HDU87_005986 [Geranomyces variabilis]